MNEAKLLLLALLTQIATATVQNMDQIHRLALEGNLTRFVHVKVVQGQDQGATLAAIVGILNDDAYLSPGHRRRLSNVEQPDRIFRPAGKHEEKHVTYGLDRWFKIAVASDEDDVVEAGLAVEEALTRIESDEALRLTIERAEASLSKRLLHRANDPLRYLQDHYDSINLDAAHNITAGSSDVVVSVLDTGLQLSHPDFQTNVWTNAFEICGNGLDDDNNGYVDDCFGYNFADGLGGNDLLGDGDHGVHCSGTIAADTDNGVGVAGVAGGKSGGGGARIMTATVFGNFATSGFEDALVYAADMGARISSNSWGYTSFGLYEQSVLDAIDYTTDAGCIVVFAAGNDDSGHPSYPGFYHKTVNVASLQDDGRRSYFSNYGFTIDVAAPGSSVLSTIIDGYGYLSGTSMACPHVAGVLALGFSINPGLSNDAALGCLYSTASDVDSLNPGYENYLGAGMIDAYAFLNCAVAATLPPTSMPLDPSSISCDFEDAYLCGWTTGNIDGKAWTRTTSGTPSVGTGPDDSDGYFMFIEASYEFSAGPYLLTSPTFNAGGATYTVSFDVHMYGSTMGNMAIQYLDGQNWIELWSISGDQGTQWIRVSDLQIPSTASRIQFSGYTGSSFRSDICIDNVDFKDVSSPTSPPVSFPASLPTSRPVSSPTSPPTSSPTYSPTSSPTVPVAECALIVDGNPSTDSTTACVGTPDYGQGDSISTHKTSLAAGTFCCGGGGVAFCDFDCEAVDFQTAESTCISNGLRLCTEAEILGGAAIGSGCQIDYMHVWSSTPASCPGNSSNMSAIIAECVDELVIDDTCGAKKSCAAVVDGNPSSDSMTACASAPDMHLNDYFVKGTNSTAGVRCCGNDGGVTSVCDWNCELVDYEEAVSRCDEIGMRLCTAAEVLSGNAVDASCAYDYTHVWVGERIECPDCAMIVDGNPALDNPAACPLSPDTGLEDSLIARMDSAAAGVRCCSADGSSVKSFCDYPCERVEYNTAVSRCEEASMRLCTSQELLDGKSIGTGCSYDTMHVWSSETNMCSQSELEAGTTAVCVVDGDPLVDHPSACGGKDWGAEDFKLVDPEYKIAGVRCCSDSNAAISLCPLGSCELTDYQTAKHRCEETGMRLCTAEELLSGKTAQTGCLYDLTYVWSSNEGSCTTANLWNPKDSYESWLKLQECIEIATAASECDT